MAKSDSPEVLLHRGYQRYCCICGRCWIAKRRDACYCGSKCRQAAHRGSNPVLVRHKISEEVDDDS
jgi:hypothetical protein